MASKKSVVICLQLSLCFLALLAFSQAQDLSEEEVWNEISGRTGISVEVLQDKKGLAIELTRYPGRRAWASDLSLQAFQDLGLNPGQTADNALSYPNGESSGGWAESYPEEGKESFQKSFDYIKRMERTYGFQGHLLVKADFETDSSCYGQYYASHAEPKLVVRKSDEGDLRFGTSYAFAVSQMVCPICERNLCVAAVNNRNEIVSVSARRSASSGSSSYAVGMFQYKHFSQNGMVWTYTRKDLDENSKYEKTQENVFNKLQNMIGPSTRQLYSGTIRQKGGKCERQGNAVVGLGRECKSLTKDKPEKDIPCPNGGTVTGVYGTFAKPRQLKSEVLYSLGPYCDGKKQPSMGQKSGRPFEIKCAKGEALIGLKARAGDFVDAIGTICQKVKSGKVTESKLQGGPGGAPRSVRCKSRAAVFKFQFWSSPDPPAFDRLGICCE